MSNSTLPDSARQPALTNENVPSVGVAVATYRELGYGVCRIDPPKPGEQGKCPPRGWAKRSLEAGDFADADFAAGDAVGILCGWFSDGGKPDHSLVCVDLDAPEAVTRAGEFLPDTDMLASRPGKPKAHRVYLVPNASIPDGMTGTLDPTADSLLAAKAAGKHPGPRATTFRRKSPTGERETAIDFLGCGRQFVAPPSSHKAGRRKWVDPDTGGATDTPGKPAVIDFGDLWTAVTRLADAIGCLPNRYNVPKPERRPRPPKSAPADPADPVAPGDAGHPTAGGGYAPPADLTQFLTAERERRCRAYLRKIVQAGDLPRTHHGGDNDTFRLASIVANDFALAEDPDLCLRIMTEEVNVPLVAVRDAWEMHDLARKVNEAVRQAGDDADYPFGGKLGRVVRRIVNYRRVKRAADASGAPPTPTPTPTLGDAPPRVFEWGKFARNGIVTVKVKDDAKVVTGETANPDGSTGRAKLAAALGVSAAQVLWMAERARNGVTEFTPADLPTDLPTDTAAETDVVVGRPLADIAADVQAVAALNATGGVLFADTGDRLDVLAEPADVFRFVAGAIPSDEHPIDWRDGPHMPSRAELISHLIAHAP